MSDEINTVIKDKKDTTQKAYLSAYKGLMKILDLEKILNDAKTELNEDLDIIIKDILEAKSSKNPNESLSANTKRNYLNVLELIFKEFKFDNEKEVIHDVRENISLNVDKERTAKNKILMKELPNQISVDKEIDALYQKGQYLKYVVNFLISTYNLRNKDLCIKIVNNGKKMQDKNFNYLIVSKAYIGFVRNVYKTRNYKVKKGIYGIKTNRIYGNKFRNALLAYMETIDNQALMYNEVSNGGYVLFKKKDGTPYDCNSLSDKLRYLIISAVNKKGEDIKLNETKINKIKVKDINDNKNTLKNLHIMEKNRGTKVETIQKYYDITN